VKRKLSSEDGRGRLLLNFRPYFIKDICLLERYLMLALPHILPLPYLVPAHHPSSPAAMKRQRNSGQVE